MLSQFDWRRNWPMAVSDLCTLLFTTVARVTDAITKSKIVLSMSARSLLLGGNAASDSLYFDLEETHPSSDGLAVHMVISLSSPRTVVIYNSLASHQDRLVRLRVDRVDTMVSSLVC